MAAIGSPAKMACKVDVGIEVANITKAIPMLNRKPVVIIVDDMPAPIPRLLTGDAFIIEATFGATNIPDPIPIRIIGNTKMSYETLAGRKANHNDATAEITRPPVLNDLAPYLSDRKPLRGPTLTNAIENGIIRIPAVNASNSKAP